MEDQRECVRAARYVIRWDIEPVAAQQTVGSKKQIRVVARNGGHGRVGKKVSAHAEKRSVGSDGRSICEPAGQRRGIRRAKQIPVRQVERRFELVIVIRASRPAKFNLVVRQNSRVEQWWKDALRLQN